jgi:hypothetical protein
MNAFRLFLLGVVVLAMPAAHAQKAIGKNMMLSYIDNTGRDVVLTWLTDTGKSTFYAWDTEIDNWAAYEINLPPSPLSPVSGKVMMVPYIDNSGRDVVLVWDSGSGKSVFYAWDTQDDNWAAYDINLPAVPVPDAKGTVMMSPYVDKSGRDVVLVWDSVTGKSVFYAWDTQEDNWAPYEINLPANPSGN